MKSNTSVTSVDDYIAAFPAPVVKLLKQMRKIILETAPDAEEYIGYQMPGYKQNGVLVYFAGYKNHLGFYPGASAIEKFSKNLEAYNLSKGTIQFPLDAPLPVQLIKDVVRFRLKENIEKAKAKKSKA